MITNENRKEIVIYRMQNAESTLAEVESHCKNGFYNTAVNRMYYACYYAASALFVANNIQVKTHDGVRQQLGLQFVQKGIIPPEMGHFYAIMFGMRSSGDYEDFVNHDLQKVNELFPQAKSFVETIKGLIDVWLKQN